MTSPQVPTPAIPSDAATSRGVYDSLEAIRSLLIPGEALEAMSVQRRLFALLHRRQSVGATSGRLIHVRRGLFGGFTPVDLRWQDLHASDVRVGIFGATLRISAYRNEDLATREAQQAGWSLVIKGLRKAEAQEVYRVCQAREQAWREKRRVRELEELRARSGGIQVGALGGGGGGAPAPVGASVAAAGDTSPAARLQRAREMLDTGLLTDTEFEQVKARILAEL